MPLPTSSALALKEWAVAVNALGKGEQILILRKGGIHRSDKEFRVVHPNFLLYPTYEHQRLDLVKTNSHHDLQQTIAENNSPDRVRFGYWCEVTDKFQVDDNNALEDIASHHIWTADYANKRLRWRPKQPLTVALLRVYILRPPQALNALDEYGGCKSWVELERNVELGEMTPVLSDEDYEEQAQTIRQALNSRTPVA